MHTHCIEPWQHSHVFLGAKHERHELRTWSVVALTAAMMLAEIVGGTLFGSMAVIADGWPMSTAGALGIAAFAYHFVRRHARDPRFSFGTDKLGEVAAFASAVILALIAFFIGYEAVMRLASPVAIHFSQAIAGSASGAWLLFDRDEHHHRRGHPHAHDEDGQHYHHDHGHDTNLRAAYVHVLADALTSVLAIVALSSGLLFGWVWMDPSITLVGVAVILSWSFGLIRASGAVLLDTVPDRHLAANILKRLEVDDDRVSNLHVWRLGPGHTGVIAAVVSDRPQAAGAYKARLAGLSLSHVTVEVHVCKDHRRKAA